VTWTDFTAGTLQMRRGGAEYTGTMTRRRSPIALLCALVALLAVPAAALADDPMTGKDRLVVGFHMRSAQPDGAAMPTTPGTADLTLRKGEKIEPAEGHAYAEIVSGPRSGMHINTSANARHGQAFVLVDKADFDYHIYGSGADRVVVRAAKRD
jgi:hypothetical protein